MTDADAMVSKMIERRLARFETDYERRLRLKTDEILKNPNDYGLAEILLDGCYEIENFIYRMACRQDAERAANVLFYQCKQIAQDIAKKELERE